MSTYDEEKSKEAGEGIAIYKLGYNDEASEIFVWRNHDAYGEDGDHVTEPGYLVESDELTAYVAEGDLAGVVAEISFRQRKRKEQEEKDKQILAGFLDRYGAEWIEQFMRSY